MDDPNTLTVGQKFENMNTARETITLDGIATGLALKVTHSDSKRYMAICREQDSLGCPFAVRVTSKGHGEEAQIRKLIHHTCDFTQHKEWKRSNSAKLLAKRHEDMIRSDLTIKPSQIQNVERIHFSRQTPYLQAWRARKQVRNSAHMSRRESYQLISPFLQSISPQDTDEDTNGLFAMSKANVEISLDSQDRFQWCYIAPRACVNAFWSSRRFICLDGAHMKDEKELVLLLITTLDANENSLPLMWGYFKTESTESWLHFLSGFRRHFIESIIGDPQAREDFEHLTIVSDRGKGLVPAVAQLLPKAFHYHCTQHLAANVGNEFGKKIEKIFRAACQVDSQRKFKQHLDEIEAINATARFYVNNISTPHYAHSAAPLVDFPRYGQTCSNIVESMNSAWMEGRQLPLLYSIQHLWNYMMKKFYERRHDTQKHDKFTNYCMAYFKQELQDSFKYLVSPQERENQVGLVYRTNISDISTRRVELKANKCSCLAFQDHKIPCRHAIAVARFFEVDPLSLIADFYQLSEYRRQYEYALEAVLLSELQPDSKTKPPPALPVTRGRKVVKRLKRTTRETEARRRGRMISPETRSQREEEAQARYLSGTTYAQGQTVELGWLFSEVEDQPGWQYTIVHTPSGQNSPVPHTTREAHEEVEAEEEEEQRYQIEDPDIILISENIQRQRTAQSLSQSPPQITLNIQGSVSAINQFSNSSAGSLPNFTQNFYTQSPRKRPQRQDKQPESESENNEVEEPPTATQIDPPPPVVRRSSRPRKRTRRVLHID